MRMEAPINHIEIRDGIAFLKGRAIKIRMIAMLYDRANANIEHIMDQYGISAAEVHAALAYYYDNLAAFSAEEEANRPLLEQAERESGARLAQMRKRADDNGKQ